MQSVKEPLKKEIIKIETAKMFKVKPKKYIVLTHKKERKKKQKQRLNETNRKEIAKSLT